MKWRGGSSFCFVEIHDIKRSTRTVCYVGDGEVRNNISDLQCSLACLTGERAVLFTPKCGEFVVKTATMLLRLETTALSP